MELTFSQICIKSVLKKDGLRFTVASAAEHRILKSKDVSTLYIDEFHECLLVFMPLRCVLYHLFEISVTFSD